MHIHNHSIISSLATLVGEFVKLPADGNGTDAAVADANSAAVNLAVTNLAAAVIGSMVDGQVKININNTNNK
jgi:hypothetical protein